MAKFFKGDEPEFKLETTLPILEAEDVDDEARRNDPKAVEITKKLEILTDMDVPESFWQFAVMCERGRGMKHDPKRAFETRLRGAELDEPNSILWLAISYYYALGTPYDRDKALVCLQRIIDEFDEDFSGYPVARSLLAVDMLSSVKKFTVAPREELSKGNMVFMDQNGLAIKIDSPELDDEQRAAIALELKRPSNYFLDYLVSEIAYGKADPESPTFAFFMQFFLSKYIFQCYSHQALDGCGFSAYRLGELYFLNAHIGFFAPILTGEPARGVDFIEEGERRAYSWAELALQRYCVQALEPLARRDLAEGDREKAKERYELGAKSNLPAFKELLRNFKV